MSKCQSHRILQPNAPPTSNNRSSPILLCLTPLLPPSSLIHQHNEAAMGAGKWNELERLMPLVSAGVPAPQRCTRRAPRVPWRCGNSGLIAELGSTIGLIGEQPTHSTEFSAANSASNCPNEAHLRTPVSKELVTERRWWVACILAWRIASGQGCSQQFLVILRQGSG